MNESFVPGQSQSSNVRPVSGKRSVLRRNKMSKFLIGLLAILLLVAGIHFAYKHHTQALIDRSAYQAVFLANGQVYFGKLDQSHRDYLTLTNIYYLQVQDAKPAGETAEGEAVNPQDSTEADTQLIKLGKELHAPKDSMTINKDQVLFWEDIKEDGKVAQAIKEYEAKE